MYILQLLHVLKWKHTFKLYIYTIAKSSFINVFKFNLCKVFCSFYKQYQPNEQEIKRMYSHSREISWAYLKEAILYYNV